MNRISKVPTHRLNFTVVMLTIFAAVGAHIVFGLNRQPAVAAPVDCALGSRLQVLDTQLSTGSWSYPLNTNIGNFNARQVRSVLTNTGDHTLYDIQVTLPYVYMQQGTRYRPAHWVDERGLYITDIGNASPDATNQGLDPTDPGFTAYILDAAERPEGVLTPWTRQRVGDIPMPSLSAAYYNASYPTSLSEDDRIPTWSFGDLAPGDSVVLMFELRIERRAGGQALGWQMPEVHAAANLGCAPILTEGSRTTADATTATPIPVAADVIVTDFDTTDFNGGTLVIDRTSLPARESISFGRVGNRVAIASDETTVTLDGVAIGVLISTGDELALTFTHTLTLEQLGEIIRSIGLTGATTSGTRSVLLRLSDPEGNQSNTISLSATLTAVGSIDSPPLLAPDAGIAPSFVIETRYLLLAIIATLGLIALFCKRSVNE